MQGLLKSDIFFFVTTCAVVLLSIGFAVALFYIIRILKDMTILSRKARDEGQKILDDVSALREDAKERGETLGKFLSFFGLTRKRQNKRKNTGSER